MTTPKSPEPKSVRRWALRDLCYIYDASPGDYDSSFISTEDHERVVAELRAEVVGLKERLDVFRNREYEARNIEELKADVLQYHRMAASGVWIESKAYNRQIETIAKQAKAIEALKACISKEDHRCGLWHDGRKAIEQAESIERGEA